MEKQLHVREIADFTSDGERVVIRKYVLLDEYERVRDLTEGLLGLIQLVCFRNDVPKWIADALLNNHRYRDAMLWSNGYPPSKEVAPPDSAAAPPTSE